MWPNQTMSFRWIYAVCMWPNMNSIIEMRKQFKIWWNLDLFVYNPMEMLDSGLDCFFTQCQLIWDCCSESICSNWPNCSKAKWFFFDDDGRCFCCFFGYVTCFDWPTITLLIWRGNCTYWAFGYRAFVSVVWPNLIEMFCLYIDRIEVIAAKWYRQKAPNICCICKINGHIKIIPRNQDGMGKAICLNDSIF